MLARIRTQLVASAAAAALIAASALLVVLQAARQARASDEDLRRAQLIAHEVSAVLVLTQDYAAHFEERAQQQWQERVGSLSAALRDAAVSPALGADALQAMRTGLQRLPDLFARLSELSEEEASSFTERRKQFLLDQLQTGAQALADGASRWTGNAVADQQRAAHRLRVTIVAVVGVMLLLMLGQGWWLVRRVLRPLAKLERATMEVEQGRLDVRLDHAAHDELGALARRFDAMTQALAERSSQLEAEARLRRQSERLIRAVTDNMPALIAYIDKDERYRFTNAYYRRLFDVDPQSFIGRSLAEQLGEEAYAELRPHVAAVLRGERVRYERQAFELGPQVHLMVDYQPDVGADGSVDGFYVLVLDISARKQAELRQAQSEERVRSLITHAPDAFIGMDGAGAITEWNQRAEQTFGWTRDEALGRQVADVIIPPAARGAHNEGLARFRRSGTGPVIDARIQVDALHRDGRLIPVELSIGAVREGDGYVANAFLHDISERKAAEAQLAASEFRLRGVTNSIPAIVGYFDREQRLVFANSPSLKFYGLTLEQARGMTMAEILGDYNYAQHAAHVEKALSGKRSFLEGHIVHGGQDVHFQAHLIPDRAPDNSIPGYYVMTFDVTPLKSAERARAAGEQRLRTITDNLPVLISYIDRELRLRFCNGTFQTWMGIDPAQAVGRHVSEVVGQELYEQRRAQMDRALAGERVHFEIHSEAFGVSRHLQTDYIPDRQEDGSIAGIYTMSTDVTELKKVQQQLSVLARYDTLTGLPNRRQFEEKLQEAVDRGIRARRLMAVLFLDVDKFKSINDTLGHAAGDEVLKEFALRLTRCVRRTDTVARLAGDEFVVILEGLNTVEEPQFVARKILATMAPEFEVPGHVLQVSTSIGIAVLEEAGVAPARLLAMADQALYEAKAAGRNTFRSAARAQGAGG